MRNLCGLMVLTMLLAGCGGLVGVPSAIDETATAVAQNTRTPTEPPLPTNTFTPEPTADARALAHNSSDAGADSHRGRKVHCLQHRQTSSRSV